MSHLVQLCKGDRLFAAENNMMMGMDKEKCMAMYKSMHEMNKDNSVKKEFSIQEKHQELLNSDNTGYGG